MPRNHSDFLQAFVEYASVGEAPLHILWWVGVSTVAGALRRRVWIDQGFFHWIPNFYIVVVAPPGVVAKSTAANIGMDLLRGINTQAGEDVIHFGPDISSWQSLVQELGKIGEQFDYNGGQYPMSAMTVAIDEFGTFIDPFNREQIDNLTNLWDGKRGRIWKATKTQGHDLVEWPWLNIFACTTPTWLETNFPESFLGSGFLSRLVFLFASDKRQLVAYPSRALPPDFGVRQQRLVADLQDIASLAGPFTMTEAAYAWGEAHYAEHWGKHTENSRERQGFAARKQGHLHKLAMIVSAARGHFPRLDVEHLEEAERQLAIVEPGITSVLGSIGSTALTRAAKEIVEVVGKHGVITRADLFRTRFFRRLSNREYDEALKAAQAAGLVEQGETGALRLREKKQ